MRPNVDRLRKKIEHIDDTVVELLKQRITLALEIGRFKQQNDLPIYDKVREQQILSKLRTASHEPIDSDALEDLFKQIIRVCRETQLKEFDSQGEKDDNCDE